MKVINFIGGPSSGKSTLSGELFGWMKRKRFNVEYVPEFAKDLTWEKNSVALDDQFYIFGNQHYRLYRLKGQVDYAITDSPLLLSLHFINQAFSKHDIVEDVMLNKFKEVIFRTYNLFDNKMFLVDRNNRKFVQAGRNETEEQSKRIDNVLQNMLDSFYIDHYKVSSLDEVITHLNLEK